MSNRSQNTPLFNSRTKINQEQKIETFLKNDFVGKASSFHDRSSKIFVNFFGETPKVKKNFSSFSACSFIKITTETHRNSKNIVTFRK